MPSAIPALLVPRRRTGPPPFSRLVAWAAAGLLAGGESAGCRDLLTEPTASAPEADRTRTYAADHGRVFDAALAALQGQGYLLASADRSSGLVTTDPLVGAGNQTRRRASLTVRRTGDPGRITVVATVVEEERGTGGGWAPSARSRRDARRLYADLLDAIGRRLAP